jgi:hypothetical protein
MPLCPGARNRRRFLEVMLVYALENRVGGEGESGRVYHGGGGPCAVAKAKEAMTVKAIVDLMLCNNAMCLESPKSFLKWTRGSGFYSNGRVVRRKSS